MDKVISAVQDALGKFTYFGITDAIDVLIVAFLLYQFIKFIRGSGAERLLKGLMVLLIITWVANIRNLQVLSWLLNAVVQVGLIALVIIFQPELRKMLERFGRSRFSFFRGKVSNRKAMEQVIAQTVEAVSAMSWEKTGALIVFERNDNLLVVINTGTVIHADVNAELLKNIFYPKAPLHDGAVIISGARLEAAGCILPLTNSLELSKELGTRHRAAIGMSENYDSVSVVVSEESGSISFSSGGILKRHLAPETLERLLMNELLPAAEGEKPPSIWQRLKGGKA